MQFPAVTGNRLRLFTDGDESFEAAFEAIRTATERVWLETYMYEPDAVGDAVRDLLADAAKRGCSVILIFDRWGSPKIDSRYVRPIVEAGGQATVFNPLFPGRTIGRKIAPFRHRDHRKILITDHTAFCGGSNVSTDYGGPGDDLFYDITLEIRGPAVRDLAAVFLETLARISGDSIKRPALPPATDRQTGDGSAAVQVLALDRRLGRDDLDVALRRAIETATDRCRIMTPYFIPPRWFLRLLTDAAERGVDVRILTAGRSDVPLARVAGRHLYGRLLHAGIRVFEKQEPILHAKCITVDGRYSIVGSYNVDAYGSRRNLEIGIASPDADLARRLEEEFELRTSESEEIDLEAWLDRPLTGRAVEWLLHWLFRV